MKAGKLKHRVTIERRFTAQDSIGQTVSLWQELARVWARVEDDSSKEVVLSQSERFAVVVKITLRYRSDITNDMRIVFDGDIYDIKSITKDANKTETILQCEKGLKYET